MHMRSHRAEQTAPESGRPEPEVRSVHVLSNEKDLRAALRRAAEYDQRTADMLLSRSAHYRSLLAEPADEATASAD